jgi:hypothetical protein
MAPSVAETAESVLDTVKPSSNDNASAPLTKGPLKAKGVLDQFESFDVTPVIGREFKNVNLKEWLRAPNSDELLRDLAITSMPFILHLFASKARC